MVNLIDDHTSSPYHNPQSQVQIWNYPNPLSYGSLTPQSPGSRDIQTAFMKEQMARMMQEMDSEFGGNNDTDSEFNVDNFVGSLSNIGMDSGSLQSFKRVKWKKPLDIKRMSKKALSQQPAVPEIDHSMDSSNPSYLSPYNDALHRSHSNSPHTKEPANLSQPTTTPQIDVSASGFNVLSSSGILTKSSDNFYQTNITRENNAIAFSFNDNFLVRLSGRYSSPVTVAHQGEMHGTKERPDALIKTRSTDFFDRHQILDNFSPK